MDELSFYDGAYTGQEIDNAIGKVRNPDITPTASSSALVTSGGVKAALTDLESDLAAIHATGTTNTTGAAISSGTYFYLNGALVQAKADIDSGAPFTSGTNYAAVTVGGLNSLKAAIDALTIGVCNNNREITHTVGTGVWLVTVSTSSSARDSQFVAVLGNYISSGSRYPMTILNRGNTTYFPSVDYTNGVFTIGVAYDSFATFTSLGQRPQAT